MGYIRGFKAKYLGNNLDLRIRMFNILAITGMMVGIISTIYSIISNEGMVSALANMSTCFIAYGLMYYGSASNRYELCYTITVFVIFIVAFTFIFFFGGGYHGAMPFFFIFAVVFTIYMIQGLKAIVIAVIELIYYTGLCTLAYLFPETVSINNSDIYNFTEVLVGYLSVSIMLGSTMFIQFKMYNKQNKELEAANNEAIKLNKAKSSFLANMSHEIRTPINVMLGMNEMILRESESIKIKNYSANIKGAGKILMQLINNVLDVSKIESGKFSLINEEYKTHNLIKELSMIGEEQASNYGLSFNTEVDSSLPSVLIGDFVHLTQIIVNFLGNAAKYTKEGNITLKVSKKQGRELDEILLVVSVIDTGLGIKKENINKLFEAFTRGERDPNEYIEGTGLGLSIAKSLAELMGGQVSVESEWGVGSTFTLEVIQRVLDTTPIERDSMLFWKIDDLEESRVTFIAPNVRVLVVDDNKENLQVIRLLLSNTLMDIETAESGLKSIEMVDSKKYDVILMDYMMPDINGIDTLRQLKRNPSFNIPVVALTANIVSGTKEKLLKEGFVKYISKPILWEVLEDTLISLLPKDKVSLSRSKNILTNNNKIKKLSSEALKYGIIVEKGMSFLGGDINQYGKIASLFINYYTEEKLQIDNL